MKRLFLMTLAMMVAYGASAEGYQVNTLSAKQLGMGHTGVSQKLGSESLWFNPAAAVHQEQQLTLSGGASGIYSEVEWINPLDEDDKSWTDNDISTPLYFNVNYKMTDDFSLGLSFTTPFGSSLEWDDDWAGANLVQNITLRSYTIQPTASFKLMDGRLSLGVGVMFSWGTFEMQKSLLPLGYETGAIIGGTLATMEGLTSADETYAHTVDRFGGLNEDHAMVSGEFTGRSRLGIGVNIGAMYDLNDQWSLGLSYRSKVNMNVKAGETELEYYEDDLENTLGLMFGSLEETTFSSKLPLPSVLSLGATYHLKPNWDLSGEVQMVGWSAYDSLSFSFASEDASSYNQTMAKNYKNSFTVRLGSEYVNNDWLTSRVGIYFDQSPVSSDYYGPETPSMNKLGVTCGVSYRPFRYHRNVSFDIAYGYVTGIWSRKGSYDYYNSVTGGYAEAYALATGATAEQAAAAALQTGTETHSGYYSAYAHMLSFGVSWGF